MRPNKIVHILFESDYDESYLKNDSCLIYSEDEFGDEYFQVLKALEINPKKVRTYTIDTLKFCEIYIEFVKINTTNEKFVFNWNVGYKVFTSSDAEHKYIYKADVASNILEATTEATSALVSLEMHEEKEDFFIL